MALINSTFWTNNRGTHFFIYGILIVICTSFIILTIIFAALWLNTDTRTSTTSAISNGTISAYAIANGIIGFPPRLPNDGNYVQWTILQMNDVYELLPLDRGRKGGLARVAYMRQLLKQENNNTITVLGGDLVSPSALGTALVNGTALNGKQMIATMNTLGLDYMAFGNHEFDLNEANLLARMNESNFTWIGSNVFRLNSQEPFGSSVTYKVVRIDSVRILFIGLTIDRTVRYARISNRSSLVEYTKQFLSSIPSGSYDVAVALTHLDLANDIELATLVPKLDLILGGHEHENSYVSRGTDFTSIYKADANAATVYIHRCAFNTNTSRFRVHSTLAKVSQEVPEDEKTSTVANYWYNLGIQAFEALGYKPLDTIGCLPTGVELDGRDESVRNDQTLLTTIICESMIAATVSTGSTIAVFNSGAVRIDDVIRETIIGYDVLRMLPFVNFILTISVPGTILARVLKTGLSVKGTGMFLSYIGISTTDGGNTWLVNGVDVSTSGLRYLVTTIEFARDNTEFVNPNVTLVSKSTMTQTAALTDYLKVKYPNC